MRVNTVITVDEGRQMLVRTRLAQLVAAGIAAPLLTVAAAAAAGAHGAPLNPVSRSAACGSDGSAQQSAACRAARAGDRGQWFDQWDNVRVANVNGRDRQTIPNGKLCSGGVAGYGGLDLARSDWPRTKVRAGKSIAVRYRGTIPHAGRFRMYVTKDGYNPKQALRWADLEAKPFLTATDPDFTAGAYAFSGKLPKGKVGRHVIYTVWQNTSTPDTYYSCSDVVFAKPAAAAATTKPTAKPAPQKTAKRSTPKSTTIKISRSAEPTTAPAEPTAEPTAGPTDTAGTEVALGAAENLGAEVAGGSLLLPGLAGAGLLALAGTGGALVINRRRRRSAEQ